MYVCIKKLKNILKSSQKKWNKATACNKKIDFKFKIRCPNVFLRNQAAIFKILIPKTKTVITKTHRKIFSYKINI